MAVSSTFTATLQIILQGQTVFATDAAGGPSIPAGASITVNFDEDGGTAPTAVGYLYGSSLSIGAASVDLLLAHATDPFQGAGDAVYPDPTLAISGNKRLKLLLVQNNSPSTQTITVTRGATNGLPILAAASDATSAFNAGGVFLWYDPTGTAVLTTGTNDKLTITGSASGATCKVLAIYGS